MENGTKGGRKKGKKREKRERKGRNFVLLRFFLRINPGTRYIYSNKPHLVLHTAM